MNVTWGYVRISTPKQSFERQINNIKKEYPDAIIIQEVYSGITTNRPRWNSLEKKLKKGDTVVFDEISRMSRNADEGMELYERLFDKEIHIVFLNEPHLNSDVYRNAMNLQSVEQSDLGYSFTNKLFANIAESVRQYMIAIVREQIRLAFQSAQRELEIIRQRTSEGVRRAQVEGKQVGRAKGSQFETKKSKECKPIILKHSKTFGGSLCDEELKKLLGISYGSLYKYKRELKESILID